MVENLSEIIKKIKNKDMVNFIGLIKKFIKEIGIMENSMEKVYIYHLMVNKNKEYGLKEN